MTTHSQATLILRTLKRGKTITPMDALDQFGCFRLAARICELREAGYPIEATIEENAEGKRWARYRMGRAA